MRAIPTALALLVVAITPLAVAGNKGGNKKGGGGGAGHANLGKGGGGKGGGGGMMRQGNTNRGIGGGGGGKRGQQAGGQGHQRQGGGGEQGGGQAGQGKGNRGNNFVGKSTHGQVAFHGQGGGNRAAGLHSRANGSFTPRSFRPQKYSNVIQTYRARGRIFHERTWWVTHYNRVVIVNGGWYYWDDGYWYPAWGYDPAGAPYVYDGPIYSYDNLPPDEVIMNVQSELEFQGYPIGKMDGQLGPETQTAIKDFQRENGLEPTAAVDYDTANLLGLLS
jgi:hypothetical protein